jgi:branched-chain amino acid transport system substrate-binding protein
MAVLDRRALLAGTGAAGITALAGVRVSHAEDTPGVTATEIKIGSTTSLSGPVSALGVQARCQEAYFRMLSESGGIAGHQIKYIYYDDAFNPAKTVEQTRRLIESDNVAFLFNMLGTAPNSAVVKYINAAKVPHLFLSVNGDKWGDYESYPWTMGFAPSARIEAQVFAKYALSQNPNAKFAVLFQNDDLGKDFVHGLRDVLGARFDTQAAAVSHEVTDPTIDSQMVSLRAGNADVLISGTTAKFAAQSIRKIYELGWKPMHFITSGAASISSTINPVGPEKAQGVITSAYLKDASDPAWADDAGIKDYLKNSWRPISAMEIRRRLITFTPTRSPWCCGKCSSNATAILRGKTSCDRPTASGMSRLPRSCPAFASTPAGPITTRCSRSSCSAWKARAGSGSAR